tara:strand:+ start:497 stop:952 length:456 start_codon:yes stop_codon:yes gene_type:complete
MRSSPIYRERVRKHTKELMEEGYRYTSIVEYYGYAYTKEMLPEIQEDIDDYKKEAERNEEVPYYREWYDNKNLRKVVRLEKLRDLIKLGLTVEIHGHPNFGTVKVNEKYEVNLIDWYWSDIFKSEWESKKQELKNFLNKYVFKESYNEINT